MKIKWDTNSVAELLGVRAVFKHYRVDPDTQRLVAALEELMDCEGGAALGGFFYSKYDHAASPEAAREDALFFEEHDNLPVCHYRKGVSKWGRIDSSGRHRGPAARGGATECFLYKGKEMVAAGRTVCLPIDQFCYKDGRDHAFAAAVKNLRNGVL